jgi:hypothetical protein
MKFLYRKEIVYVHRTCFLDKFYAPNSVCQFSVELFMGSALFRRKTVKQLNSVACSPQANYIYIVTFRTVAMQRPRDGRIYQGRF